MLIWHGIMLIGELNNALGHFPEAVKLLLLRCAWRTQVNLNTTVLRFYLSLRNAQVLEMLHHKNVCCWLQKVCWIGVKLFKFLMAQFMGFGSVLGGGVGGMLLLMWY